MVMGHYSTALLPYAYEENRKAAPFIVFLAASQLLDFIMFSFVLLGIEKLTPSQIMEVTFFNIDQNMMYSHDIVPVILISLVVAVIAGAAFKSMRVALWVLGLGILHELLDLTVGFYHNWFGPGTAQFGLNSYIRAPVASLVFEALLCAGIVTWYVRKRAADGQPVSKRTKYTLYGLLVGGTLALLPIAVKPLGEIFGG